MRFLEVPMKTYRMLANASVLLLVIAAAGCAPEAEPVAAVEESAPAAPTAGNEAPAGLATPVAEAGEAPRRLMAPVRGEAAMVYVRPVVKAATMGGKNFIVTTMEVKNVSAGSIAGLKVDEFWYNKAGAIVTGDNYRHPKPIQPDEVVTVTLETPRAPNMDANQIKFEHANGAVTITLVDEFEPLEPEL